MVVGDIEIEAHLMEESFVSITEQIALSVRIAKEKVDNAEVLFEEDFDDPTKVQLGFGGVVVKMDKETFEKTLEEYKNRGLRIDLKLLNAQIKAVLESNIDEDNKNGLHNLLGEIKDLTIEECKPPMKKRFFLKGDWEEQMKEVTKEEFIKAERAAGFRPKLPSDHPDYMKVCATGGFGSNGVSGTVRYEED